MRVEKNKAIFSFLLSGGIISLLFLFDKVFSHDDSMFFFYHALINLSMILIVAAMVLVLGRLMGRFNINLGIFIFSFFVVNALVLISSFSKGMSNLYYIILILNLLFIFLMGAIIYAYWKL